VSASNSEKIVAPKKIVTVNQRPVPRPTWKKGTTAQVSQAITSETLPSNTTGASMMPEENESQGQGHPTRKRSSYESNKITDVDSLNQDLVTPARPSKKIKTHQEVKFNKPLQRTGMHRPVTE
jgi:hypothetical protein